MKLGFSFCYTVLLDKRSYFLWGAKKETGILRAISVKGKKLHTVKAFNELVSRASIVCWRHKCHKHNLKEVSQFFVIKRLSSL